MATTRAFRSGNGQAVRIPAEMAFEDGQELTIERSGDVVVIRPMHGKMQEALAKLRSLPKPALIEAYEPIEMPERERP